VLLLALWWTTLAELRRRRPEVLHAHWIFPGGLVVALIPRRLRPRTVLTAHGTDVELAAGRMRPVARWIAGRVDEVGAVSAALATRAEVNAGLAAGSVAVVRLPLVDGLAPTPVPDGPRTVLAAGRASAEKGFDVLVRALAELPEVRATLVTGGPDRADLEAQVGAAGIATRTTLRDPMPRAELLDLVRGHHVVVVPSRQEGLGLVALEALALGRPVVASAVGGLPEVVGEGDGRLVAPDDPSALAAAIREVPLDPPVAAAVERHRPEAVVAAHRRFYGFDDGGGDRWNAPA
jgi:glycosyltransferase involved in cell wall biosynthesis